MLQETTRAVVFVFAGLALGLACAAAAGERAFHHDHILGTSFDLIVWGTADQAALVERTVLDEIERIRRIISTYDPASEVNRLRMSQPARCSPELIEVLRDYEQFNQRSTGAYNAQIGELIAVWKAAQNAQKLPDATVLAALAARASAPAWRIDGQDVVRLTNTKLSLDSLGKGYIITKALAAARAAVPDVEAVLLNIGGDIRIYSRADSHRTMLIAVADPFHPEDNSPPLTRVRLDNAAISTSAGYERGYDIAGKHYSHILDPRTGYPACGVASATVIASDNTTANALATTLCVLQPPQGLELVQNTPGASALIIAADGRQFRSSGFSALEAPPAAAALPQPNAAWPKDFQVSLSITLKAQTTRRKPKRAMVAIWIENDRGQPVRNIAIWGNERKYFKDLPGWWSFAKNQQRVVNAVTRASRPAGRYRVVWDGLDDAGKPVAQGTYKLTVEANREHGRHVLEKAAITCGNEKASVVVKESVEWEPADLTYGPKMEQQ